MQKKNRLVWMFVICFTLTTLILLHNHSSEQNINYTSNIKKYFKLKNDEHENKSITGMCILSEQSINEVKQHMKKRIRHVQQVCKSFEKKSSVPESVISKIVLDKKNRVSWCPVFKAASSTWMKHFADLSGVLTDVTKQLVKENLIQLNNIVKQVFSKHKNHNDTLAAIAETKRFMIVRHPFERLLSAYRDKLEYIEGREYYYKRFGRHIVLKYRQNETIRNRTTLVPSFFEFLQFIVNEQYYDEHWIPFYESCEPCLINYNYILKFENLRKEQLFLLMETGLIGYVDSFNEFRNKNPRGPTTDDIAKMYFKNIPKLLLERVYDLYRKDFLLFSYVPDKYFLMTSDVSVVT